jgi:hypothetical protein
MKVKGARLMGVRWSEVVKEVEEGGRLREDKE